MRARLGIDTHGPTTPPHPRLRRAVLAGLACLLPAACGDAPEGGAGVQPARPSGAVAAGSAEATQVGLEVLARGGNAADAAVAVSLALAVTEPARSGLGGGISLLVRLPGEEPTVLYAPTAPLAIPPSEPAEGTGPASSGAFAAVPALLPVLAALHREHGSGQITWSDLVQPSIRLASEGHPLGRLTHRTIVQEYARLLAVPGAAALVLTGSRGIPAEGTVVRNPALASTLQVIAREGPGALYGSELGRRLIRGLRSLDVPVQEQALSPPPGARRVEALRSSFRGHTVWVPPDPFGGPHLLRGLRFLEAAPPALWSAGEPFLVPWLAEAVAWSMSTGTPEGAEEARARIPPLPIPADRTVRGGGEGTGGGQGETAEPDDTLPGRGGGSAPATAPAPDPASGSGEETTHFSVADGRGMIVSASQSLGRPFGSGVPAGDLGFFLGDVRGPEVEPPPGRRSLDGGVRPDPAGAPPDPEAEAAGQGGPGGPGRDGADHMLSWATPTLVEGDDHLLALGSPGGPRGVSAVLQVVARWIGEPAALPRVLRARRLHLGPGVGERGRLYLEGFVSDPTSHTLVVAPAPWTDSLRAALAARGFLPSERDIGLLFDGLSPWFGGVNAVMRLDGEWSAVADPRRDGHAGVLGGSPTPGLTPPGGVGGGRPPAPGG